MQKERIAGLGLALGATAILAAVSAVARRRRGSRSIERESIVSTLESMSGPERKDLWVAFLPSDDHQQATVESGVGRAVGDGLLSGSARSQGTATLVASAEDYLRGEGTAYLAVLDDSGFAFHPRSDFKLGSVVWMGPAVSLIAGSERDLTSGEAVMASLDALVREGSAAVVEPGWGVSTGRKTVPPLRVWMRSNLGRDVGLNADWLVSAWSLGGGSTPYGGGAYYLVDNENDTWGIVRRWYVDEDYAGLPRRYQRDADGHNDAIVEIATFDDYPRFTSAVRWLEANMPRIRS